MNESELARCARYAQVILDKSVESRDVDGLISRCSSFDEFRVLAVIKFSERSEALKGVVAYWRASAVKEDDAPDANIMLHMLENLEQKQNDIERRMRDAISELLAKLQAIDSIATSQIDWRSSIDEIRTQITMLRDRLDHIDDAPWAPGRSKK